jgi:hypothetical protein
MPARYADPATYLYTPEQWAQRRAEFCKLAGEHSSLHREPAPEAASGVAR